MHYKMQPFIYTNETVRVGSRIVDWTVDSTIVEDIPPLIWKASSVLAVLVGGETI